MIAPCGLNCAVCSEALREDSPCVGCRNEGRKGEYCANLCKIVNCEIRKTLPDGFCDRCPQYPCREIVDKECWYVNAYPMIESLMGNLALSEKMVLNNSCKEKRFVGLAPIAEGAYRFMTVYVMAVAKNIQIENIEYGKYNSK